jgi:hypothetical protein
VRFHEVFRVVARALAYSLVMGAAALILDHVLDVRLTQAVVLLAQVALGIALYAGLNVLWTDPALSDVRVTLSRVRPSRP